MDRPPDSYSYHEVSECDERGRTTRSRWVVIAEWLGPDGEDIEEVDHVADFATEAAASRKADQLNKAKGAA